MANDAEIEQVFAQIKEKYGKLDVLVHAIAFAPPEDLKNDFLKTTREGFRIAHDVSVYSLIALSRGAAPLMTEGGSIITLTYYGAEKVVPHYKVMGVAKASLSPPPLGQGLHRRGRSDRPRCTRARRSSHCATVPTRRGNPRRFGCVAGPGRRAPDEPGARPQRHRG